MLASGYGFYCATELLATTIANFNEYQGIGVGHDQVDLTMAAAIVSTEKPQAVGAKIMSRLGFLRFTKGLAVDESSKMHTIPSVGGKPAWLLI